MARSNSEGFEKLDFGENLCGVPHSYEKWHLQYEFELKGKEGKSCIIPVTFPKDATNITDRNKS